MSSELKIQYLGQSGFHLTMNGIGMLIDPSNKKSGDVDGALLYCTHNHSDHIGGVTTYLERNENALFVANVQVLEKFPEFEDRSFAAVAGETYTHDIWNLEFIEGKHGLFRGILNLGVIVRVGEHSFGHCGDTVTFQGFYDKKLDALAVPISGAVTASPKKALEELKKFQVRLPKIIPMHWLFRNPETFREKFMSRSETVSCSVMRAGDTLTL
ncbi:MAG: MBL fold metallo-hydrolase [Candidatus Thorarchaeota archaeon]|nr:MBL fold metallo-hydrolase [Candidatus Thorarchaeota archaeon]